MIPGGFETLSGDQNLRWTLSTCDQSNAMWFYVERYIIHIADLTNSLVLRLEG